MIDVHCHLADPRIFPNLDEIMARSAEKGITKFVQGGVGPEDWKKQKALKAKFPQEIITCFGLHPYWVSSHTHGECSEAILDLEEILGQTDFMGELGLDFREKIVGDKKNQQVFFFEKQLDLLKTYEKIAVFHFVRCHNESVEILKKTSFPRGGLVHAFNSNYEIAKKYLDLGLMISVGGPLLRENNHALQEAVKKIPLDKLLLESDSPDQPPPSRGENHNEPWTVLEVAAKVAELRGISYELVITNVKRNSLLSDRNLGR
jgi:TatD DNase family protein